MANINLLYGTVSRFDKLPDGLSDLGSLLLATDTGKSYLYFDDGTNKLNVVPRLLAVANGGTGTTSFTSGEALIGNGADAIGTRAITDKSAASTLSSTSTNLITERAIYYYKGSSSITTTGTITSGKWQGTTVAVGYGGTGKTSFTTNGILYGNSNSALNVTAAGTQGQIFSANASGVPSFATPTFTWVAGTTAGPTWKLTLQSKDYTAVIPSATKDNSGIVTTDAQTFAGDKTFNGTIISSSIRPRTRNTYTSGSSGYPWAQVYSHRYNLYDTDQNQVGAWYVDTKGAAASADGSTAAVTGKSYLVVGNNKAASVANNSKGYLYLYHSTEYATILVSNASSSSKTITIPNYTGYMVVGHSSDVNPTSATTYNIPFYYTDKQRLGANNGFRLTTLEGTTSSQGYAELTLGNGTASGKAGNKYGAIKFWNAADESFVLRANPTNVNEESDIDYYNIYLPVPDADTSELMYHPVNTAVGSSSRPVYINTKGKPVVVSTMSVAYGGTGANTFTSNGILYGNSNSALQVTAAGTQGQIFSANSSGVPSFTNPSWTWTGGTTAGPTLSLNLHSKAWTTAAVPSASGSASGIVTTSTQTFAGVKTFSNTTASTSYSTGAVKISGGLGVAGNIYTNGNLGVTGNGIFTGDIEVKGCDIFLGASTSDRVQMTYANDTLTITFVE